MSDETLDRPAKSAAKAEHVAWAALVHNMTEAEADELTKEQLLELSDAPVAPEADEEPDAPVAEPVEGPTARLFRGEGGAVIRMALPLSEVMAEQVAKGMLTEAGE